MNVTLYATSSDNRKLNKSLTQVKKLTQVQLKTENNSITDPILQVAKFENYEKTNYVYIEEFKRFYFIRDINPMLGNMLELTCHVDVLMSHKNSINNLKANVIRSSNANEPYLVDTKLPLSVKESKSVVSFPNHFNDDLTYVLITSG